MPKEKPILFSTPMVQSIQKLIKTMTRRLKSLKEINENPDQWDLDSFEVDPELMAWDKNGDSYPKVMKGLIATFSNNEYGECFRNIKCPWEVGQTLWVRETWYTACNEKDCNEYKGCQEGCNTLDTFYYKADELPAGCKGPKWRPSIFMPKDAARIFLKVTNIRVERLQDITEEDAIAEGIKTTFEHRPHHDGSTHSAIAINHIGQFRDLWDGLNSKRGYDWDVDPWCWVVEFEVLNDR